MTTQTYDQNDVQLLSLLDALLDIKRLAEKCGDADSDPFALLDLIADKASAAILASVRS